jgi:hypothetical protein
MARTEQVAPIEQREIGGPIRELAPDFVSLNPGCGPRLMM